ncbi:MAG: type II secretion system protein GspM [Verrucomicrobiota bacterium]|nr:type II secretion system protein GspM [Verrucomicrobiota bacterium]
MTGFLDKLNLRPQEKRLVVIVGFGIFVLLNWWFVRPFFGQWSVVQNTISRAESTLDRYQKELANVPKYEKQEKTLQTSGSDVLDQELALQRIVQTQAATTGVMINRYDPRPRSFGSRTNQFFEDQVLSIDFTTGGKELVDFLVNLATGNSMIRVREMSLKPDPSQTRLIGSITFIASYQKKPSAARPATPVASNRR